MNPPYGKIVEFDEAKRRVQRERGPGDFYIVVGVPSVEASLLRAYSEVIDKLCCVRCSEKEDCELQDGSCWEDE